KATTGTSALMLGVFYLSGFLHGFPRSVFLLNWGITVMLLGGFRLAARSVQEGSLWSLKSRRDRTPAVVVGAGNAAARLLRELRRDRDARVAPVALLDDDPAKRGMCLHGVAVAGSVEQLPAFVGRFGAKVVIIAIPSASREQLQRIVTRCR